MFYITDKLNLGLTVETDAWRILFGTILSKYYHFKLKRMIDYIEDKDQVLGRAMKDLEDVRLAMKCLAEIRDDFIFLDGELMMIEETFNLMGRFHVSVMKEDQDIVDSLRYSFNNMLQKVFIYLYSFFKISRGVS